MMIEVRAEADLQRWLDFVSPRGRHWYAGGVRYERDLDGLWYRREHRPESHQHRTPELAVDADRYARNVAGTVASQGDVNDALKGLEPVPVETPEGGTRLDYRNIPLKNTDGTLTRYAKNLLDLHAPQARAGAEFAGELVETMAREEVERADGVVVALPVQHAEPLLKAGRVRTPSRRKRGRSRK